MLDIAVELSRWCEQGRAFAVATVVSTEGSAPRQPGAALAVDTAGEVVGSVSGGCVEGAVYELCEEALQDGAARLQRFGYSDEDAFAVGLTCGGTIDILVTPVGADATVRAPLAGAAREAAEGAAAAVVRVVEGPNELCTAAKALWVRADGSHTGTLGGGPALDATAAAEARARLDTGRTGTVRIGGEPEATSPEGAARADPGSRGSEELGSRCGPPLGLFVECSVPPPRMLVFGAIDFAAALVRAGVFLGYRVTVCDARPVFATQRRFPEADEVVVEWPHDYLERQDAEGLLDGRSVVCVLTHDAKFDVPLLERALRLPVGYVGAMGSRRTHLERLDRLRETGLTETELARLRSPIGLDLGARTPEETALSIVSEIVADRRGGSGAHLTGAHTPIHHEG